VEKTLISLKGKSSRKGMRRGKKGKVKTGKKAYSFGPRQKKGEKGKKPVP